MKTLQVRVSEEDKKAGKEPKKSSLLMLLHPA